MVPRSIVIFLLFFLPLLVVPFGASFFEPPKVIVAEIAIELLLLFIVLKQGKLIFSQISSLHLWLIGILTALTIAQLILTPSQASFFGNQFRLQGVLLLWHLLAFSLIAPTIKLDQIPKLVYLSSIVLLLLGAIIFGVNQAGRFVGTLGEPNALSAVAVFVWPFAWFNARLPGKATSILATLLIILLSGSRSGLVAILVQAIFVLLAGKFRFSFAKSTVICLVLLAMSLSLPIIKGGDLFENRAEVWQTALLAGLNSPILGHGFGNIEQALHQASVTLGNNIQYQRVDSAHNLLLDFWVQGGLIGLALINTLLYLSISGFLRNNNKLLLTAFLGIITVMSFNPVSVVTLVAFWWLIGQGFKNLTKLQHLG